MIVSQYGIKNTEKNPEQSSAEEKALGGRQGHFTEIVEASQSCEETFEQIIGHPQIGRRAARLEAVARELRKIGYIVMVNSTKSGMVVITRE